MPQHVLFLMALFVVGRTASAATEVELLRAYLDSQPEKRPKLDEQPFASAPLTRGDADAAQHLLWDDHVKQIRQSRAAEMKDHKLTDGKLEMHSPIRSSATSPRVGAASLSPCTAAATRPSRSTTSSGRTRSACTNRPRASISRPARRLTPGTSGTNRTSTASLAGSSKTSSFSRMSTPIVSTTWATPRAAMASTNWRRGWRTDGRRRR
jgi:hypothetical protein